MCKLKNINYLLFLLYHSAFLSTTIHCSQSDPASTLYRAVTNKERQKAAKILTEYKENIDELINTHHGQQNRSLLHIAASTQDSLMIELLLDHNAQIDIVDHTGSTPLHLVFSPLDSDNASSGCQALYQESIKYSLSLLLKHEAKLNYLNYCGLLHLANKGGKTPYNLAMSSGYRFTQGTIQKYDNATTQYVDDTSKKIKEYIREAFPNADQDSIKVILSMLYYPYS